MSLNPVTMFGPDFPFGYDDFLSHPAGLGRLPEAAHGTEVAIIGAGIAGITAAFELMKLGLKPVIYESDRIGGRLRSEPFREGAGAFAELGAMRFPPSSRALFHYIDLVGLETRGFPNPLASDTPSTVIELAGAKHFARTKADLPPLFGAVERAWNEALEEGADWAALTGAIRNRDAAAIRRVWAPLVETLDEETFSGFIAKSRGFRELGFRAREIFGQVGFGTGGWDTDFPNSILEILRASAVFSLPVTIFHGLPDGRKGR